MQISETLRDRMVDGPLRILFVPAETLKPAPYNPRRWDEAALAALQESLSRFGFVDPLVVNGAVGREHTVIGGHMRLEAAKRLGIEEVPVVYVNIPELEREKELNLRLNHNNGEWDWDLLAAFDEKLLVDVGFTSEELDEVFGVDDNPETFDLAKELAKLDIATIETKKGDIYALGPHRLMCGDSTSRKDVLRLMDGEKATFCFTDPPYRLDYLRGKKKSGKPAEGFGLKRNRRYLETDSLPEDFTERWMENIAAVAADDFHIICFENWRNLREMWGEVEKYWRVRNMIVWRLPNRTQGFSAPYRFFSKYDIAVVGSSGTGPLPNLEPEGDELLDNEYETALYATRGKPPWEPYKKGGRYCPTDFVEFNADDAKHSGQGVVFGTKPVEILVPYIKVLTKRGDLVVEPFGGSGSTMIAAEKLGRRCNVMEISPVYCEVIRKRWEKLTRKKSEKINK